MTIILANRLNLLIGSYIHPDWVGFLTGWYLKDNVRKLFNILNYFWIHKISILFYFLNAKKAFSRVVQPLMKSLTQRMAFGPVIRKWINLIYNQQFSIITVEGVSSKLFNLTRGIRQRCPLCPILFNLVVGTLAISIRNNLVIMCLSLPSKEFKLYMPMI